LKNISFR